MLPPAQYLPIAATAADVQAYTGEAVLMGWTWTETTGSASAELSIIDGTANSAPEVCDITLSSGQSTRDSITGNGLYIMTGLRIHRVSGTFKGTLWFLPVTGALSEQWAIGEFSPYRIHPGV